MATSTPPGGTSHGRFPPPPPRIPGVAGGNLVVVAERQLDRIQKYQKRGFKLTGMALGE
ncbi:hypothetical protein OAO87_00680 [bacterium]|nr:hypothetical protein [bacterium]